MSYSEFPHTTYSDHDHVELILLYKKLVSDYAGTLEEIKAVSARLDKYESDMNGKILDIENRVIPNAVNRAVSEAMYEYQQDINNRFNALNIRLSTVETMYDSIQNDIESSADELDKKIVELRAEMIRITQALSAQIGAFNAQVDSLSDEMKKFENSILKDMENFKLDAGIEYRKFTVDVKDEISMFEELTNNWMNVLGEDYKLADEVTLMKSKAYTDEKVSALHTLIETLDLPTTLKEIKWVWQYGCCFGGYDALQWYNDTTITCEDWNKSNITCVDWYVRGREIFKWFERLHYLFSPISGKYVDVRVALLELASALKINGLSAEEYDKLGFTAQEYENFNEKAIDYDWNGRDLLDV